MNTGECLPTIAADAADALSHAAVPLRLRLIMELSKFPISALSTLSAAACYLVHARSADWRLLTLSAGVILLAMGACALNQVQDRRFDALMARTCNRPIPRGAVIPSAAVVAAGFLIVCGAAVLALAHNLTSAALGIAAVAWYNGLYTYLKRKWALAVIPGALIGALPPVIGWTSAGGAPFDPAALALALFFFVWQVPHFWLLVLSYADDYQRAGLPSPADVFGPRRLSRMTGVWMMAAAASSLLLPLYDLTATAWASFGLGALGLWIVWEALRLLRAERMPDTHSRAFRCINMYALCVICLLALDALL